MTYTITGAQFANSEHTAAVIQTVEAGAILVSLNDTPDLWAKMLEAVPAPSQAPETWREGVWAQFRDMREVYMYRLEGIAGRAFRSGDTTFAAALDVFIQGLLDVPQHPTTQPDVATTQAKLGKAINARFVALKNEAIGYDPATATIAFPERKAIIDKVFK